MTSEQIEQIKNSIKETIILTVNGKIDKLNSSQETINVKIDTYIREDLEYKERMTKETEVWRASADSKLEFVSNVQGFGRVSLYVGGFILTVGGAIALFIKGFRN